MSGNIIDREKIGTNKGTRYLSIDETGRIENTIMTETISQTTEYAPEDAYKLLQFLRKHEHLIFIQTFLDYTTDEPDQETHDEVWREINRFVSNSLDRNPLALDGTVGDRTAYVERIIFHPIVQSRIVRGYISVRQVTTWIVEQRLKDGVWPSWITPPKTERELWAELETLASAHNYRLQSEDGLIDVISETVHEPGYATSIRNNREGIQFALDWLHDRILHDEDK